MISFRKVDLLHIRPLREQYLDLLYESQELYLEWMIRGSDIYAIRDDREIGYFIVTPDKILIEYYLTQTRIPNCETIFAQMLQEVEIAQAYCKSFDSILLKCCLAFSKSYRITGTLFRDYYDAGPAPNDTFSIRPAMEADIPFLLNQEDGLYDSPQELVEMVSTRSILLYSIGNDLVGCGFLIRIIDNRDFYDIGMWVNPNFRRKGHATAIIADLKNFCLQMGIKPVCGCAYDNVASRRTLEKNGFVSKHNLIQCKFRQP